MSCFLGPNHSVACPSWLAMEWCWLQTGWQGLQGGQDPTVTQTTVDLWLKTFPLTDSDHTSAADFPHPVSLLSTTLTSSSPLDLSSNILLFSSFCHYIFPCLHLLFSWNSCVWVLVIVNWSLAGSSMSWMSRLNPRGPGNRSGHNTATPGPCTADPETCLMVFENHWRQVSRRPFS